MATAPQTTDDLLTAEEFARRFDTGVREELVRGRVVAMPPAGLRHAFIIAEIIFVLRLHLSQQQLGRVFGEGGVITARGPDSVRGPDVSFYRYERLPKEQLPVVYAHLAPDLVFEVMSPDDRWRKVLVKVAEYLEAGVSAVAVLDPERRNLHLYEGDQPVRILGERDEFHLPAVLGDLRVEVGRFFG